MPKDRKKEPPLETLADGDDASTRQVADYLGCEPAMVRIYRDRGYITPKTRSGLTGRAQRAYYRVGEVKAFKEGGAPTAQAYRERNALKPRRTRKARVA
jgi:hypothetical protein